MARRGAGANGQLLEAPRIARGRGRIGVVEPDCLGKPGGVVIREQSVGRHGLHLCVGQVLEAVKEGSPQRFGKGAIEGVAAPESANNAAAQACFIPMLSLGIPPNALMALMIGAMMVHGITPGPEIITKQPELF